MRYIKLGKTGLDVSPIALGSMTYGQPDRGHPVWSLPEVESRPLIKHALGVGVNFFDTANMYSQGSACGHRQKCWKARLAGPIPLTNRRGFHALEARWRTIGPSWVCSSEQVVDSRQRSRAPTAV